MQIVTGYGLPLVTTLQRNANLCDRFEGVHPKRRGPKQKLDGKVDFERWILVTAQERERVLPCVLYAPHFERDPRVVVMHRLNH
ncbi:hypothetical protein [Deinococcus hopiensis]|uniref:hypothetical protein n=1 Tax=Deinococcus hopiensis TaxID=309885 RepID=UPI00111C8331|nr:hypothetical protein [Deinococcus hopiensis]